MGLFWSMTPPTSAQSQSPEDGGPAQVAVLVKGKTVATTTIARRSAAVGVKATNLTVARNGFYGRYYSPPLGTGRHTPVLLFSGSQGGLALTTEAALLASHGYPALAIAYFKAPGLPKYLVGIPLEYFATAIRWLDRQPSVDPHRLTVLGDSRGTEAALELGVHYPSLVHAVIGLAVTSTVYPGTTTQAAWTFKRKPIPFLGSAATIQVERIRGPILVVGGGQDMVWPSFYSVKDIAERTNQLHGPPVTALDYPNAGHLGEAAPNLPWLSSFTRANGLPVVFGGSRAANAAARADLWPKLLNFLAKVPRA
jgi:dienelactone hydrolase